MTSLHEARDERVGRDGPVAPRDAVSRSGRPSVTIVLPAYNEAARIVPALDELFGYLRRGGPPRAGGRSSDELGAWDVLILALAAVDLSRLPSPPSLTVTRTWSGALSLGARVRVTLAVENTGLAPVTVRAGDYLAPALRPDLPAVELLVGPGEAASGTYDVRPRERGDACVRPGRHGALDQPEEPFLLAPVPRANGRRVDEVVERHAPGASPEPGRPTEVR